MTVVNQFLLAVLLLLPVVYLLVSKSKPKVAVKERHIGKPTLRKRAEVREDDITVTGFCRGTEITEAKWTPVGFQYDREWCIINAEDRHVLTLRGHGEMTFIHPRIEEDASSPYGGWLVVDVPIEAGGIKSFSLPLRPTPDVLEKWQHFDDVLMFNKFVMDGYVCEAVKPGDESPSTILSTFLKRPVFIVMKGPEERPCLPTDAFQDLIASCRYPVRLIFDVYPIHYATEESLESVNRAVNLAAQLGTELPKEVRGITGAWQGRKVGMDRFRPNIVFKGAGVPYAEELWRAIEIGSPVPETQGKSQVLTTVLQCERCLTGERDAAVPNKVLLKYGVISKAKKAVFGSYAVPEGNGVIRVGDKIRVVEWIEPEEDFGEEES
ncbi:hypothetical protein EUX98_g3618 [Antrodiella citrinella]|uniref:MOSC domain-containing protein n=1 Tax=Antrodiella citrinella TaxID=2447956 RepID=A0A4S4N473_9APHY|nr:hypothetical protein EUX98_g3618 [Antrodiella citrinella]